ncbi:excisionase family DNA-binding protein [Roseiconus lacunae]|uniref:Excisionase family DNA-binding protein n=1 Tax=Roseiconus lacunae TaxID=2605694 RepID=A0ABT7PNQ7_9BACT|nr:excisionase family DNA-binding protein [Roseiconus lacunae]MDM4018148.1 excisionase family DNA-binding protein [Roseiconus lacunae]
MNNSFAGLTPLELESLANAIADRVADRLAKRRRLLTRHELSHVINVSVPKIDTMLRDNELPAIRVGRKVLFDPYVVIHHLSLATKEVERATHSKESD